MKHRKFNAPCGLNDTVFIVCDNYIQEGKVEGIHIGNDAKAVLVRVKDVDKERLCWYRFKEFTTGFIFTDETEAEKYMKMLNEKKIR